MKRRAFIASGLLVAAGTVLQLPSAAGLAPALPGPDDVTSPGMQRLVDYVRQYSGRWQLLQAAKPQRSATREVHLLVELTDLNRWPEALSHMPFPNIRAQGNALRFPLEGWNVTVENLMPDLYRTRLAPLS